VTAEQQAVKGSDIARFVSRAARSRTAILLPTIAIRSWRASTREAQLHECVKSPHVVARTGAGSREKTARFCTCHGCAMYVHMYI
jgi:hypothetical protein